MKILEVRRQAEWDALRPVWNDLLDASAAATTFLTWEWLTSWWSAYGRTDELRILTATDDGGRVRGIAPLRDDTVRAYGRTYRALTFVGDGSNDSDYLDFIVERGFEHVVMRAWLRHLAEDLALGVVLRLNEVPAASPALAALKSHSRDCLWSEESVACALLELPRTWDEYLGALRPRFRTRVRSVLRHLEGRGDVRFGFCETPAQLNRLLPELFDLHTRRWKHDGQPGVFGWDRKRNFYAALSPLLLERGSLRLSWLRWNDRLLACQYGFVHGSTYFHLQEGYEPACEHWNVGIGLRAWTIREFLRQGIAEYDFLGGIGRHKTDWGAAIKESRRVTLAAPSMANHLLCKGPEWHREAKEAIKAVLPEKILSLRQASLPRAPARSAAATCYFHLGGPAATRLLRARYQVSGSARILTRRREPSARILYYHRVNDDRDPFFPATPVRVFERQVRHIARHYRVVSLSDMLQHLAGGSPEPVLSVTFDDGYRDNFENAFPILRRYGVPATIFLSTGSVDSREPLWFEVLAAAIKQTSREFIDIETDLPRRFWMRTQAERVAANGALFSMLRRLPDGERQQLLNQVLRDLAAPDAAPRADGMLTWDQARLMARHSIHFGGHTVTHPYLSRLSGDRVSWEVSECKRRIETELQMPVTHFAYPNGREEDFTPFNKDLLRRAGYRAAVTTLWGVNTPSTDPLELRRGQPWEEDEALFAWKLDFYELVNG